MDNSLISISSEYLYHPIETYFSEVVKSNIYIGEDSSHLNKFFMLLLPSPVDNTLLPTLTKLNSLSQYLVKSITIYNKADNESYIIYEYNNGIRISDYILNSVPDIRIRINLLKQFIEILLGLHEKEIPLFDFNSDFCFIENLEEPNLKMIYNVNGYIKSTDDCKSTCNEESNDFYWLSRSIFVLTRYNKYKRNEEDFSIFFSECDQFVQTELKSLFTNTFNKCKGMVDTQSFTLNTFIDKFNVVLERLGIETISNSFISTNIIGDTIQRDFLGKKLSENQEKMVKVLGENSLSRVNTLNLLNQRNLYQNHENKNPQFLFQTENFPSITSVNKRKELKFLQKKLSIQNQEDNRNVLLNNNSNNQMNSNRYVMIPTNQNSKENQNNVLYTTMLVPVNVCLLYKQSYNKYLSQMISALSDLDQLINLQIENMDQVFSNLQCSYDKNVQSSKLLTSNK